MYVALGKCIKSIFVCMLMYNLYICFSGSKISEYNKIIIVDFEFLNVHTNSKPSWQTVYKLKVNKFLFCIIKQVYLFY